MDKETKVMDIPVNTTIRDGEREQHFTYKLQGVQRIRAGLDRGQKRMDHSMSSEL